MRAYESRFRPGRTWYFTLNLADENSQLLTRHARLLGESSYDVECLDPFDAIAAVILPDHMHMIWTLPEDDRDFDRRISHLKEGFRRRLIEHGALSPKKQRKPLWHARYWDYQIRDLMDLERHLGYMHGNPVRHGLVSHPDKWRYSTWHRYREEGFLLWTLKPLGTSGEP